MKMVAEEKNILTGLNELIRTEKKVEFFIYPSIHYLLSTYKRTDPTLGPRPVAPKIRALGSVLEGGFPEGRCTAFLGVRGGHKSYLGFMHVVDRVLDDECGLIVSLRD